MLEKNPEPNGGELESHPYSALNLFRELVQPSFPTYIMQRCFSCPKLLYIVIFTKITIIILIPLKMVVFKL